MIASKVRVRQTKLTEQVSYERERSLSFNITFFYGYLEQKACAGDALADKNTHIDTDSVFLEFGARVRQNLTWKHIPCMRRWFHDARPVDDYISWNYSKN